MGVTNIVLIDKLDSVEVSIISLCPDMFISPRSDILAANSFVLIDNANSNGFFLSEQGPWMDDLGRRLSFWLCWLSLSALAEPSQTYRQTLDNFNAMTHVPYY